MQRRYHCQAGSLFTIIVITILLYILKLIDAIDRIIVDIVRTTIIKTITISDDNDD